MPGMCNDGRDTIRGTMPNWDRGGGGVKESHDSQLLGCGAKSETFQILFKCDTNQANNSYPLVQLVPRWFSKPH